MVDWDLEAPGLESFFGVDAAEKQALRSKIGLLELLTGYKDIFSSLPQIPTPRDSAAAQGEAAAEPQKRDRRAMEEIAAMLEDVLPPLSHVLVAIRMASANGENGGSLHLLPAGARVGDRFSRYAETVQSFDWSEFYQNFKGEAYFEWVRRQLMRLADVVLIDSRTGVAEMSGVCTRQLADVVVALCAPNDQNLDGVEMMARSFTRPDLLEARANRPIQLVLTPSRVDISDGKVVDDFEERFREKLKPFIPKILADLGLGFDKLRIPYIKEYAYSERLAVGEPDGVRSLVEAYTTLAAHIALLAPPDNAMRQRCRDTLQQTFGLPTVYMGFLDSVGASLARTLERRFQVAGAITIMEENGNLPSVPLTGLRLGGLVLVVTELALAQGRAFAVWSFARENGICFYFVAAQEVNSRPAWARRVRLYDPVKDWDELVRRVQSPCQASRIPLMAPALKSPIIGRENEIEATKDFLLARAKTSSHGERADLRSLALVGPAGIGKTAIARRVCHDADVVDFFDGGILWASLSSDANLAAALAAMIAALTGDQSTSSSVDELARKLAEVVSGRHCLIVCDDVADESQIAFLYGLPVESSILITTRLRNLAAELRAETLDVGPVSEEAALVILLGGLNVKGSADEGAAQLGALLGKVPLALETVNNRLRSRSATDEEVNRTLYELIGSIRGEGLEALESASTTVSGPFGSVLSSFSAALERLDSRERALLPLLASLPADQEISIGLAADTLGVNSSEANRLLHRLAAMSVVGMSSDGSAWVLPSLSREYFRSLGQRQKRAESARQALSSDSKIFISYIRSDTAATAGRIYGRLSAEFGLDQVFMDVNAILPGQDFESAIEQQILGSRVVLVLIGPQWAKFLNEPTNFARFEIARALQTRLPVIPVLVEGARLPARDLPPDVQPLLKRTALSIDNLSFNQDVDRLVSAIQFLATDSQPEPTIAPTAISTPAEARSQRHYVLWGSIGAAVLALLAAGIWQVSSNRNSSLATPSPQTRATAENNLPSSNPLLDPRALVETADAYYNGTGVRKDPATAVALYVRAALLGDAGALIKLAAASGAGNVDASDALKQFVKDRGWALDIATNVDVESAKSSYLNAKRAELPTPALYLMNGKYVTTVGIYTNRESAQQGAITIRPKTRPDAAPIDLTSLCPYSITHAQSGLPVIVCARP